MCISKKLENLDVHDEYDVHPFLGVIRVPNGLIYNQYEDDYDEREGRERRILRTSVFVPLK